MAPTIQDLGIDRLSAEHRLRLISEIWDSLSIEDTPIPERDCEELDRRLAAADANPEAGTPWEVVRERLREEK
jgi:putative addiction module component (TIGR02574 family)